MTRIMSFTALASMTCAALFAAGLALSDLGPERLQMCEPGRMATAR